MVTDPIPTRLAPQGDHADAGAGADSQAAKPGSHQRAAAFNAWSTPDTLEAGSPYRIQELAYGGLKPETVSG